MTLPQRFLISLVRGYQLVLSPWLGNACRFEPTCSAYSVCAIERHGAAVGTYMTLQRLVRCQPFCTGGHDPVPQHAGLPFRRATRALAMYRASRLNPIDKNAP